MSTIDKMSIQGIRAFGPDDKDKQIISFFNPLTLILGPNGTGKTTIIECLKYITTGEMPPGSSGAGTRGGNAFVHDPKIAHEREVKAQVKLQFFDVNNKMRSVTRSLQAVQKEKKVQVSTLDGVIMFRDAKGNKVQTTSKCIELNKEMISFLGVSKAVLENVIFCHQEEANWPLSEGKALKQKFDDIFASTRYVKALDCIRKTRQEQVNEMKTLKDVIKYAKQNKEKASEMKEDLKQAEAKFEASCARVEEINTRLEPINDKLLILENQATDIYRLQTKIEKMKSERSQMEKNMEELRDSLTEEFTGSTDQLKRVLSQHKSKLHEQQNELSESEEMKQKLTLDEQRADRQHQEQMLLHDRLLQEAKRHRKNLQSRDERVAETAEKYGIEGYSGMLEEGMIQDFLHLLEKKAEGLLKEAKEKRAHYEEQEDAVQAKMDEARDSKTKLESGLKMKDEMMVKNKEEIKDINRQLSRVEASAGRLEDIKRDLKETERELAEQEGALDVDSYKADIINLSKERNKLDTHSRELEAEMKQLHLDSKARTELEILKKDKTQKEDNIRRLRAKNEDSLCHLLGYMPTENIKRSVEEYTRTQSRAVDKLSKEIQELNIRLSSQNINRDHLREELRKKEKEVRDGQESIFSTCDSQNFDEGLQRLQKKKDNLMDQKGALLASERMFTKYVNKLQREDPPCPLCNRCFDDQKEVQDLIYDLTQKLSMVPEKVATAEKEYTETETKYVSMIQLKPTREKISELEQHDIPRLKTSMKEAERMIEKLRSDISGKEEDLTVTQSDLETAKTLQPDMVMIDRDQYELRNCERRIVSQAAKITGGDSDRTIQQVTDEKEDLQGQLDSISRNLENKRQKLSDHTDRIQRLKTSVNALTGDKLQIEGDLQQQSTLKDRKNELHAQVTTFRREITEAREQLKPLQARMHKLRAEREKISEEKDERFEQDRKKSSEVKELAKNISRIQEEVERYINDGKDEEIVETKKRMKRAKVKLQEVQDSLKQVQESIDKIKEDLATQQVKERDLQDNLTLRTKEAEIEKKDEQIVTEQEKLGGLDPSRLERDRMKLRDEQDKLQKEKHTADGRKTTLQEQIASKRRELRDPMYATAEKDYRDKLIALRTTEIASSDLEKYYKALDSAIMRYHRCKMEELNKIIRERWRNTYKGNDIDTIEIQSDEEEGSGASKQRRSYNYRVQMIKGDTAIDMRGRCSAGQKVLASLIIRLALAETFCINCGFLALDEPTTNLDRENIESLAVALVEIIKDRRSQRNFQLLVITHDEDFVELLGRSDYVDEFYKVRKNADGCSQVVRARVQDLFSGR